MPSDKLGPLDSGADAARAGRLPFVRRVRQVLIGPPRSLGDRGLFHKVSLIALLAWVGLGADGLSSSAYGPEEAFRTLGEHTYLAVLLAVMMATTVLVISAGYSRIIEQFRHGGGGYVVASKLLGEKVGLVSGCALLVDYVLTITVSIAAAGDALFSLSFIPPGWSAAKLPMESFFILGLLILNLRGVRESVVALAPVFFLFVSTHVVVIVGGIAGHAPELPATAGEVASGFRAGASTLGVGGMLLLLIHAFSLGGGTYTGIEAVSNGIPMMRHPQVRTAKRTMIYMAVSLAFTATGLLVCYLLWHIQPVAGKTMNAVLVERLASGIPMGDVFIVLFLLAEGAILVVAAQAGFADGPRVLSNMALDSWVPRRFSALSERLTTQNGIVLMAGAALLALLYTRGDVRQIVVMYSINVFLTFSLSLLGMSLHTLKSRERRDGRVDAPWRRRGALFIGGFLLCATILAFTAIEKFHEGGWITLAVTGALVIVCFLIRGHYRAVAAKLNRAFEGLEKLPDRPGAAAGVLDPSLPTAVVLVGGYNGFGIHTTLNVFRSFPGHFRNLVFVSVGTIDSGGFKGEDSIELLGQQTQRGLAQYAALAERLGVPAVTRFAVGTDTVDEAEKVCLAVAKEFPRCTFFAGQVVFERETFLRRLLHNQTAYAIQRRLQLAGQNIVILAAKA
jgi:amino acid transporter